MAAASTTPVAPAGQADAQAGLSAADIAPLAGDDFDAKAAALSALAGRAAQDSHASRLLQALAKDNVFANDSNRILIGDGDNYRDALTDATVSADDAGNAQQIALPNVLRARVDGMASASRLTSPDPVLRNAAIDAMLRNPDPAAAAQVDTALAAEKDPALHAKLETLWAMTALHDPSADRRLKAVQLIVANGRIGGLEMLRPLTVKSAAGVYAESDTRVRAAAQDGIDRLASMQKRADIAGVVFAGLSLGSVLLLAALGLAITYGLIGVINMAHGEFLMIGAYATYVVQNLFIKYLPNAVGWYPVLAVPASFLAAAIVGVVIERLVIRHLYGRPLETLLTTFGMSLLLMQGTRMLFGAQNVQVANPGWMSGGIAILPGLTLPYNRLVILAFSVAVIVLAWTVLNRTRLGLYIRAVTQNRRMAACVGVRTARVDCYAFAFGAGIAGLGGCALSQIGNVGPDLGQTYIIDSFMSVVLGGVGQLAGTVIGAFGLGVVSKAIEPFWGAVLAKICVLMLVVLFIQKRPQGLFALKGRSAEV
ncbi:urea ABC transporter permease subunit UrtB [Robbsia sp. KACC 23696]|uniref:urea ABC transporter permease subunit UrtB n=1 Tax=Robbsia sp. KACC 23696 TaxID=3149231 RepID=UPI00325AE2CA